MVSYRCRIYCVSSKDGETRPIPHQSAIEKGKTSNGWLLWRVQIPLVRLREQRRGKTALTVLLLTRS